VPKIEPFERNVSRYEAWFDSNQRAYDSELKALRALLPNTGEGLEVGVGTGRFAAPLGLRVGVEPSPAMGKLASQRGIEVRLGVGEDLPCEDGSFDFVLVVTTLCFFDDVPVALRETYRVLRAGGYLLIGFIDRESPLAKLYEKRKRHNVFYREATFFSADEVIYNVEQAGFCDLVFRQTIFENPTEMKDTDPVKPGHGEGLFVVVRATKLSR
jgi:SAM-dependent methyltransferase